MKAFGEQMKQCCKCGGYDIAGPKFNGRLMVHLATYSIEQAHPHLVWTCRTCGFNDRTLCRDAKPAPASGREGDGDE